jgi:hypothetical protein
VKDSVDCTNWKLSNQSFETRYLSSEEVCSKSSFIESSFNEGASSASAKITI